MIRYAYTEASFGGKINKAIQITPFSWQAWPMLARSSAAAKIKEALPLTQNAYDHRQHYASCASEAILLLSSENIKLFIYHFQASVRLVTCLEGFKCFSLFQDNLKKRNSVAVLITQ